MADAARQFRAIDIHTHVNFAAFNQDKTQVIARAHEAGVALINVGTQQSTSHSAVELAQAYEQGVYATVGLHPIHTLAAFHDSDELGGLDTSFTSRSESFDYNFYKKLGSDPKVVAIGECGLDYFHIDGEAGPAITRQKEIFEAQICLARELGKPLMLHIRDPRQGGASLPAGAVRASAYDDALALLGNYREVKGNVHFFAGDWPQAQRFLDAGFTLSFTGVITFAHNYDALIQQLPLDKIMVETDAPYVSPVPYRGKRNEPVYVLEVLKRLAELKGISAAEASQQTLANAQRVFDFPIPLC